MFIERRCISCGKCQEVCPLEAINFESRERVDRSRCDLCGQCIGVCDANALRMVGREITTALLLEEVMRDLPFYIESGGGVTLSGGEPLKKTLIRLIPSFVSRMSEGRQQLRIEKRQPLMASAI